MRILIDIGHPAHVHLYKNLYFYLLNKGHKVTVTVKNIKSARELLDHYDIPYIVLGKKRDSKAGKLIQQILFDIITLFIVLFRRIEIAIGSSITITHMSIITGIKSVVMDDDDDEVQPLFVKYAHPYASAILSPDVLRNKRARRDTVFYPGYHELAYLHPDRFKPDPGVLSSAGLNPGEPYFILRFNEFRAHHDYNVAGLSPEQKDTLIRTLLPSGRVFITTESDDNRYDKYHIRVKPHEIHSFIYYAKLFIGDSQTMASEAGVLGTPAIRYNSLVNRLSYLDEQEKKYGLIFGYAPGNFEGMMEKIEQLLSEKNLKEVWVKKRQNLLNDKIDVSSFVIWFVENYPQSKEAGYEGFLSQMQA